MDSWEGRLKRGFDALVVPDAPPRGPEPENKKRIVIPRVRFALPDWRKAGRYFAYGCLVIGLLMTSLFAFVDPVRAWGRNLFSPYMHTVPAVSGPSASPAAEPSPPPADPLPPPKPLTDITDLFDVYDVKLPERYVFSGEYVVGDQTAYRIERGELVPVETHYQTDPVLYRDELIPADWVYAVQDGVVIPLTYGEDAVFFPIGPSKDDRIWAYIMLPEDDAAFVRYDLNTNTVRDVMAEAGIENPQSFARSPDQSKLVVMAENRAVYIEASTGNAVPLWQLDEQLLRAGEASLWFVDDITLLCRVVSDDLASYYTFSLQSGELRTVLKDVANARRLGISILSRTHLLWASPAEYKLIDLRTGAAHALNLTPDVNYHFSGSPDGKHIMVLRWNNRNLEVAAYIDAETGETVHLRSDGYGLEGYFSFVRSSAWSWISDTVFGVSVNDTQQVLFERKPPPAETVYTDISSIFDIYNAGSPPEGFFDCGNGYITDGETAYRVERGGFIPVKTFRVADTVLPPKGHPILIDCLYTVQDGEIIPLLNYAGENYVPRRTLGTDHLWIETLFYPFIADPYLPALVRYDLNAGTIRDVLGEVVPSIEFNPAYYRNCALSPDQSKILLACEDGIFMIDVETAALTRLDMFIGEGDVFCSFIDDDTIFVCIYRRDVSYFFGYSLSAGSVMMAGNEADLLQSFYNGRLQVFSRWVIRLEPYGHTLYDLKTGKEIFIEGLPTGENEIFLCSPSPDGKGIVILEPKNGIWLMSAYVNTETEEVFPLNYYFPYYISSFEWATDTLFSVKSGANEEHWILFALKE